MRNIIGILAKAQPGTLVLLDELGAGTDPTEGSALARAVLETLLERGCAFVATTHHGELKVFAHNDPRLRNASVEFDLESLSPTYKLTIGLPGQSNALAIAGRLGLDASVLEQAQAQLAPGHFELEEMLDEIRRERELAGDARRREEMAREESEDLRLALAERRDRIEQERLEILSAAQREAEDTLARLHREVERLRTKQLSSGFDAVAASRTLRELDAEAAKLKQAAKPRRLPREEATVSRTLAPGDRVQVRDIPQVGEALGEVGEDGRVDVQFGALRMKVSVDRIQRVEAATGRAQVVIPEPARASVSSEIDLRGRRAEDALLQFETYVDEAFRAGLPYVRIIHGKGTGALRAAIREALAGHPLVRRFESGAQNEGGDGVTVAVLAG
jgi:DNA mismatch repair protein MutS2